MSSGFVGSIVQMGVGVGNGRARQTCNQCFLFSLLLFLCLSSSLTLVVVVDSRNNQARQNSMHDVSDNARSALFAGT